MDSGSHKSGESCSGGMRAVTINFTSQTGKKKLGVWVPKFISIRNLKEHIKFSKGIRRGRILMNNKELNNAVTLGADTDIVLEMESYTSATDFTYTIPVKPPTGPVINVQVHESTIVLGLKHIIQDEIAVPFEEQVLEYKGVQIMQDKKRVVEICGYKKTPIMLKLSKFNFAQ